MAELKTRPTGASVTAFLAAVEPPARRADARAVHALLREVTGARPRMWGPSIVGFGRYRYQDARGETHEWFLAGYAPRATALTVYIMSGFTAHDSLVKRLGRHTRGKSCLYIKRLADVDRSVLRELVRRSVAHLRAGKPPSYD